MNKIDRILKKSKKVKRGVKTTVINTKRILNDSKHKTSFFCLLENKNEKKRKRRKAKPESSKIQNEKRNDRYRDTRKILSRRKTQ